jgi:hypothetical protein
MASSPTEIQQKFRAAFKPEVIDGLAKCVWAAYPESHAICSQHLLRDQSHDVRGHFRRGLIERNWKNYARRIPGALVRQESNSIGSSKHVVIEIDGVLLTQSLADSPNDIIQRANFRHTYAEVSQISLFPDPAVVSRALDAGKLYAMFLHGVSTNPKQPRFMSVVFPTRDCLSYLDDATIHVMAEFEELAKSIRTDNVEAIGDDLMLELRRLDEDEDSATATA